MVHLEDIRRYVHHGVLREEDEWSREEEERTMRRKEEEDDAKSRERVHGTVMWEPHAWRCCEELAPGEGRRRKTRGNLEHGGHNDSGIGNIVENIIQCPDFLLTC